MTTQHSNGVNGGTVAWGVILLLIAAASFAVVMFDVTVITPAVIGWSIVALGALLVVAAIVGVVARAVRPADGGAQRVSTGSTSGGGSGTATSPADEGSPE